EQCCDQNQQANQGWHAAARQHAIVDFEHEHGAGQHQHIAHAADDRGAIERTGGRLRSDWLRCIDSHLTKLEDVASLQANPVTRTPRSNSNYAMCYEFCRVTHITKLTCRV